MYLCICNIIIYHCIILRMLRWCVGAVAGFYLELRWYYPLPQIPLPYFPALPSLPSLPPPSLTRHTYIHTYIHTYYARWDFGPVLRKGAGGREGGGCCKARLGKGEEWWGGGLEAASRGASKYAKAEEYSQRRLCIEAGGRREEGGRRGDRDTVVLNPLSILHPTPPRQDLPNTHTLSLSFSPSHSLSLPLYIHSHIIISQIKPFGVPFTQWSK